MSHFEIFPFHDYVDHDTGDVAAAPLLVGQIHYSFGSLYAGAPNSYFVSDQSLLRKWWLQAHVAVLPR